MLKLKNEELFPFEQTTVQKFGGWFKMMVSRPEKGSDLFDVLALVVVAVEHVVDELGDLGIELGLELLIGGEVSSSPLRPHLLPNHANFILILIARPVTRIHSRINVFQPT